MGLLMEHSFKYSSVVTTIWQCFYHVQAVAVKILSLSLSDHGTILYIYIIYISYLILLLSVFPHIMDSAAKRPSSSK